MQPRLYYLANARIPTEKAHGITIVKGCEAFAEAGAHVHLLLPRRRNPLEGNLFDHYGVKQIFFVSYVPVLDLYSSVYGKHVLPRIEFAVQVATFYLAAAWRLVLAPRGSIVYSRDPAALFLRLLGFRVVAECHHIPRQRRLFFFVSRLAYRTITISSALRDQYVAAGFDPSHILVAPSGVDLSIFTSDITKDEARRELGLPQDTRIACYTGNFTTMGKEKGISTMIEALALLPEQCIVVAAGGREQDIEQYQKMAVVGGVSDRVILRPSMSQRELSLYNKAADALVMVFPDMPHYRHHMSPIKMFEYMAAGRPIIATDLPTIREVLDPEIAYIIPPGDAAAFAVAFRSILDNPDRASRIAAAAFDAVAAFSWHERSRRVLSFISHAPDH